MRFIDARGFKADHAWGALGLASLDGVRVSIHWTDQPYRWHANAGQEVFVVLDGVVDMHTRSAGAVQVTRMEAGTVFHFEEGDEHVAHPVGEARVLVVEREGSP
jgi:hypothetical protein